MTQKIGPKGVEVRAHVDERIADVLTPAALAFVASLHRRFEPERTRLLETRRRRQAHLDRGEKPDFLKETASVRDGTWSVPTAPADLEDRRVEITGPAEAKMMINALNSGARVFMADFEDALSPTWENVTLGQSYLVDAARRTLAFTTPEGKAYTLGDKTATLVVRPRGWHLVESHVLVDGHPVSASLFDFGLHFFLNARTLRDRGSGPYYYLPKLENHEEARLWAQVFSHSEDALGLPRGTVRATVLIETILAAFEMEEILHELRNHACGLNAGRWDYLFSVIKKFRNDPGAMLPDRAQISMTTPFMKAYTALLVDTCHKRGAHAIGGMAAFVPNRKDPAVNAVALTKVREDKVREVREGFDGTWVAHPDLVPVAMEVFEASFGNRAHQNWKRSDIPSPTAEALLDFRVPGGKVTAEGLTTDLEVALRYVESWLRGRGAVTINNLMEDAATAEICRSQVWQWIHLAARLDDGRTVTRSLAREALDTCVARLSMEETPSFGEHRFKEAAAVLEETALSAELPDFLTLAAYRYIE